jgi:hypothetical protein
MTLSALPDAIITRLRSQVAGFSNRVAGTAAEAKAAEQTEFSLPHAFVMPGGIEPAEAQISSLDQEMTVRFRVMIAVSNASDERGQAGASALLGLAASTMQALIGYQPGDDWAPILTEGLEDSFDSNRHVLWGSLTFRTSIMGSAL